MEATNQYPTPATVEAALEALNIAGDDADIRYEKRNLGGYHVTFNGVRLGWVVKNYGTNTWCAYTLDAFAMNNVRCIERATDTRGDATKCIFRDLSGRWATGRYGYEQAMEDGYHTEQRLLAIINR